MDKSPATMGLAISLTRCIISVPERANMCSMGTNRNNGGWYLLSECHVEFLLRVDPVQIRESMYHEEEWSLGCRKVVDRDGEQEKNQVLLGRELEDLRTLHRVEVYPHPKRNHLVIRVFVRDEELERHGTRLSRLIKDVYCQQPTKKKKAILFAEEIIDLENRFGRRKDIEVLEISCRLRARK